MKKVMLMILITLFCVGCKAEMTEKERQATLKTVRQEAELEVDDKTPEERALTIKNRLKQVHGVTGTAVVVEGHTAIIGLRLEEGLEQNEISAVKKEADLAARGADVSVESTSITTNSYIVSMIEEMERKRAG